MFFRGKKKTERAAIATADERVLRSIWQKCGGKLDAVVEYILAASADEKVCKYCAATTVEECCNRNSCARAVAACLRESDGHV